MAIRKVFRNTKKYRESSLQLLTNIRKTIRLYWEIDKASFLLFFVICMLIGLSPYLTSYLFGRTTNQIVAYLAGEDIAKKTILQGFLVVSGLALLDNILWSITNLARRVGRYSWQAAMTAKVLDKLSDLDFKKYEDREFNNFMNKILDGYLWKPEVFANTIPWFIYNFIRMISAVIILGNFAPWILPLILISFIPTFLIEIQGSKVAYGIWDVKGDEKRLFRKTTVYLTDPINLAEVKIFGIREHLINLANTMFAKFENEQKKIVRQTQYKSIASSILGFSIVIGIEIWMLFKILAKTTGFGIGNFIFYRNTINNFSGSVRDLTRNLIDLYDNNLFMTDLFRLFDTKSEITSKQNAVVIPNSSVPLIEFRNVSFKYPNTDKYVYKNFSLTIKPGEDIALVGENGAGKTTFVKLLMRFYDIDEGEILINGINIKDLDLYSWYKNIGVLFQDFNKYSYSVRENISLGNVEKPENLDEVKKAADDSGADKFVKEYKNGYEQMLNKAFQNGIEPSGGQWQKIALARAFYRNANILILDEPTSAIDAKAEYEIFKKIAHVQKEKTTIIISHRFSTVRNAHKIYVIDHGEILEEGTHNDLMKIKKGKYREMFELQAEGYK